MLNNNIDEHSKNFNRQKTTINPFHIEWTDKITKNVLHVHARTIQNRFIGFEINSPIHFIYPSYRVNKHITSMRLK